MGYNAAPLEKLIEEFSKFPGIGRKGATRMAYQVLSMSDQDAAALAGAIQNAHTKLHRCRVCQNYTEAELCPICASAKRDRSVICVVETPRDVQAFERTREYHGMYHVLHGLISPMDGIGAEQLTVKELLARLEDGEVKEVIMAMNPTVEGEATAMYLAKLIKPLGIKTTRLAYGLPVGASLEYTDETTLYRALSGRGELCSFVFQSPAFARGALCCLWDKKETPGRGNETNSRNIEKTQKRCKKVLTEGRGYGIILERQGPPERMTSESGRSKAKEPIWIR